MLTIDGSMLEGGGQLVRSAVALSAITAVPVEISKIREKRSPPGLRAQHVAAVKAVGSACEARYRGLSVGSRALVFEPGPVTRSDIVVDVGTAGSVPLVLQAWLPVALHAGGSIDVTGGTEVRQSPTIDYFARLLVPLLRASGARIAIDIRARGYYPAGGGRVRVSVDPFPLLPIRPGHGQNGEGICSCTANLPDHVARRQARSAKEVLGVRLGKGIRARCDRRSGPGAGSSVTAWRGWKGGSALGRRGWPAEEVGRAAAADLSVQLDMPGIVDMHLADQLLVYLARYGGCYTSAEHSLHAATLCWLIGEFGLSVNVRPGRETEYSA